MMSMFINKDVLLLEQFVTISFSFNANSSFNYVVLEQTGLYSTLYLCANNSDILSLPLTSSIH